MERRFSASDEHISKCELISSLFLPVKCSTLKFHKFSCENFVLRSWIKITSAGVGVGGKWSHKIFPIYNCSKIISSHDTMIHCESFRMKLLEGSLNEMFSHYPKIFGNLLKKFHGRWGAVIRRPPPSTPAPKIWWHKILFFNKVQHKNLVTSKMQILWGYDPGLWLEGKANEPKLITFFGRILRAKFLSCFRLSACLWVGKNISSDR